MKRTYVNIDKPTAAKPTATRLTRLAVLIEVHVQVILHLLLACSITGESNTTLLTLTRQAFVQELGDRWALPAGYVSSRIKEE